MENKLRWLLQRKGWGFGLGGSSAPKNTFKQAVLRCQYMIIKHLYPFALSCISKKQNSHSVIKFF